MAGQWLQPDHSLGDANTIGGYMKAHARPAAFEGSDGLSYSVAIEADATGDPAHPYGAYFLFLRWRRMGEQGIEGHLESEYLTWDDAPDAAIEQLGRWSLAEVRTLLEGLIAARAGAAPARRWWDVMKDEDA
jgi:hypothetical protein